MPRKENLKDRRFNRLIVKEPVGVDAQGSVVWRCICDCGNEVDIRARCLKDGNTQSCGCLFKDAHFKHGHTKRGWASSEYACWQAMKSRCFNKRNKKFSLYGGRGITVCEHWLNSFQNFLADMGLKPRPLHKYSIDRIDNDGNYEPSNCRWTTATIQNRNRRVLHTA